MFLTGRNEGLVFCGDTVLQFGLSEQYHFSLHWLCLGNYWMPSAVLQCWGWDWPVPDSKSASLSPYPSSRSSAVSPGQVTPLGAIVPKKSPKHGATSPDSPPTSVKQKYWQDQGLFCISLSIYDLIVNAQGCSVDSCLGGDYGIPWSELKMNTAMRPWEGDSISTKANTTEHQQDTQIVFLLLLNIGSVLPLTPIEGEGRSRR